LINDYYVNNDFIGNDANYSVSWNMIYSGAQAFLLQDKENATSEKAIKCEPNNIGINLYNLDPKFPMVSKSWVMFYGEDTNTLTNKLLLIPEYNEPSSEYFNPSDRNSFKFEHLFYHDNNYIVYYFFSNYSPEGNIYIYK